MFQQLLRRTLVQIDFVHQNAELLLKFSNMEASHQSFTDLDVWKKARSFKNEIYELVSRFPADEKYRLTDQLIRASRAIGSNIAEGHGRYSFKDQLHFCIQARGSLSECLHHLVDAYDLKLVTIDELKHFKDKLDELGKLLNGYITYLRQKLS